MDTTLPKFTWMAMLAGILLVIAPMAALASPKDGDYWEDEHDPYNRTLIMSIYRLWLSKDGWARCFIQLSSSTSEKRTCAAMPVAGGNGITVMVQAPKITVQVGDSIMQTLISRRELTPIGNSGEYTVYGEIPLKKWSLSLRGDRPELFQ